MFSKTHKIKFDNENNTLTVSFNGISNAKDIHMFINEFIESKINMPKGSITLVIDALRLTNFEPETFRKIGDITKRYVGKRKIQLGYKNIYILKSFSSLTNIQLETLFYQTNLQDDIRFISTKNEIK